MLEIHDEQFINELINKLSKEIKNIVNDHSTYIDEIYEKHSEILLDGFNKIINNLYTISNIIKELMDIMESNNALTE